MSKKQCRIWVVHAHIQRAVRPLHTRTLPILFSMNRFWLALCGAWLNFLLCCLIEAFRLVYLARKAGVRISTPHINVLKQIHTHLCERWATLVSRCVRVKRGRSRKAWDIRSSGLLQPSQILKIYSCVLVLPSCSFIMLLYYSSILKWFDPPPPPGVNSAFKLHPMMYG